MNITNLAVEIIRTFIWLLCKVCFYIIDFCYGIIMEILSLNLFNFGFIWSWWRALLVFMFLFVIGRLSFLYFKAMYDEETLDRINPQGIIIRLFAIGFILVLLPTILDGLSAMTSGITTNLANIVGVDSATKPSFLFLKGGGVPAGISAGDIDINVKLAKAFKYFPETIELFFVLITSGIGSMMFLFIGLQITQRLFSMMLKVLISPYAISGIVVETDNTFETWWKLFIADFLTAFFQVMLIYLVFTGINYVEGLSPVAKMIFFMGGLFTIMNAPQGVAQLLGGDVGTATAFQQMQSLNMFTSGFANATRMASGAIAGAGAIASGAGNISSGVGAAGVYGVGRMMGGKSMSSSALAGSASPNISSQGGTSGGYSPSGTTGGVTYGGSSQTGSSGSSSGATYGGGSSAGSSGSSGGYSSLGTTDGSNNAYTGYTNIGSFAHQLGWQANQKTVGRLANKGFQSLYKASANRMFRPTQDVRGNTRNTLAGNAVRARNTVRNAVADAKVGKYV